MIVTITEARQYIDNAKARGGRVLCGRCKQPATLLLACEDGTFQGVACDACFAAHLDMITMARIFEASGLADGAHCSRCGADPVGDNHIQTEEV